MGNINWSVDVQPHIDEALRFFSSQGVRPTLRTLFYNLVSKNLIGNTKSTYKGLSKWLVKARKDGLVSWLALEDSARNVYGDFSDYRFNEDIVEQNKEDLESKLESLDADEILREFFDYMVRKAKVDRWADQPTVAEIWIEKEALARTIQQWTAHLGVKIRVNKGYSSWTFLYENAQDLEQYLGEGVHTNVEVFYLGDLDPSGVDMERFLKETLEYFGLDSERVNVQRLSVTSEQVKKYNLPPRPDDAETLAKLERDPRTASYGLPFIVELDAMVAFVPQEFRQLILDAVNGCWDEQIYKDLKYEAK